MKFIKNIFKKNNYNEKEDEFSQINFDDNYIKINNYTIPISSLENDEYEELYFLLVNDNIDQQNIMSAFLKKYGGNVHCAYNGKEGLHMYMENYNKYNMIFMDIQMPIMNGIELTSHIRLSDMLGSKNIPIIAVSGDLSFKQIQNLSNFNFFLEKPFNLENLAYIIRQAKEVYKINSI